MISNFIKQLQLFFKKVFILVIEIYQHTLSPDHGWGRLFWPKAGCIFYPSCSQYTKQAIIKYNLAKGLWFGLRRLIKCRPGGAGGFDPA
ncbi:membrane protein insertion efficiency factor YidD [Patescibacteria group bacterium]|nr:membrane protein insertion efficiency factor YidD [Patescibacteria group bacterium]